MRVNVRFYFPHTIPNNNIIIYQPIPAYRCNADSEPKKLL